MKPTKGLLIVSLVMVFLVSLTMINVTFASPSTYFHVEPPYMQGTPTGKFEVAVNITDAPPSYAWEIHLSWDPDRLELINLWQGDFLHRWYVDPFDPTVKYPLYNTNMAFTPLGEANAAAEILVTCTLVGDLPMEEWASGSGWLLSLEFLVQARGGASLHLFDTRLWDHIVEGYPAATYYPAVDGLVDTTDFFFAGLDGWKLKVNGKAGVSLEGGLKTNVGEQNLLEANVKNSGSLDAYVQAFFEIRDSAGYWLATIPSDVVLLPSGQSTILSATWIANGAGMYYITAYSTFYKELIQVTNVQVGTGNGVNKRFFLPLPIYPSVVVAGSVTVYLGGTPTAAYKIDYATGKITFNVAPAKFVVITADYTYHNVFPDGFSRTVRLRAV